MEEKAGAGEDSSNPSRIVKDYEDKEKDGLVNQNGKRHRTDERV